MVLKKLFPTVFAVFLSATAYTQHYLMRDITIPNATNQRVGDLLEQISAQEDFYFAYNSQAVDQDRVIGLSGFRGTLIDLLEQLFDDTYEFKESPGYVIIRYAPETLELTLDVEKKRGRQLVVEGQIRDASNKQGVYQASIYERNVLVSTLSDTDGNFRLMIKRPEETVWLTVSKEHYRDTTVALLSPVQVGSTGGNRRNYGFYPGGGEKSGLEGSALGRFFVNSKQRIQGINLGGFFAHNPYQVSLTPGISSQGLFNSQVVNQVSLNVVGGYTAGVRGVEVGGVFNVNQQDVKHVQVAGVFNLVGGHVRGVQLGGVFNAVPNQVFGLQGAGVVNRSGNVHGMQFAGFGNFVNELRGLQLAGVVNWSSAETGNQIAGLVNVGGKVNGIQLAGLLNVADSSDYPVGLVNLIRNGEKQVMVGADESGMARVVFRSGGRRLYGLVGLGYGLDNRPMPYGLETGLGVHLIRKRRVGLDMELVNQTVTDFKKVSRSHLGIRLLPQVGWGTHWGVMAGPTLNFADQTTKIGLYGGLFYRW